MIDFDFPLNFDVLEDEAIAYDIDREEFVLGDIVLCEERIYSQAKDYGHNTIREMAFLVVHSMLHLLGYDHNHDNKVQNELTKMTLEMEKLQEEILGKLGILR